MLTVLSCIALEHDPLFLALSVCVLTIGAFLTMRLFPRVRSTRGNLKYLWLLLSGLIAGGTIWSTHFVAMIAYQSPFILGYDLGFTLLSLLIAVLGSSLGLLIGSLTRRSVLIEIGGLVFGASIAAMHFTGIAAMQVSGILTVTFPYLAVSIVLACLFGLLVTNRIARPVTRYCKYGAALSFILAVVSLHFVAMAGTEILPLRLDDGSNDLVSNELIGVAVVFTISVLMLSAMITYSIDVENNDAADSRMNHITHHDPLTGLPNRRGLDRYLTAFLSRIAQDNARAVVLSCNLTRFKEVNEVLGHAAGDCLLRHVAENLAENLEIGEYIARINGDEFVVVGKPVYYRGYKRDLCKRVQKLVSQPMSWQADTLRARCSIGYATYPDHAVTASSLLRAAEQALHRARQIGGDAIHRYEPDKDRQIRDRGVLAMDLQNALRNGEFELFYQSQNEVATDRVTGVEALLRWNHPRRGMVPPAQFIPIAEDTGLIREIGAWALRAACHEATSWSEPVKIAVNVAPVQLADGHFPELVAQVLDESGLEPDRLELEITETGIIADTAHALQIIRRLKRQGVKIAMDDFGTGYSSLATLQAFPFDKIKIDREFIRELGASKQSDAIVRATIILGNSLEIPVLAEGVETEDQLALLASQGCAEVQGYLFGKPVPAVEIRQLVHGSQASKSQRDAASRPPGLVLVNWVA